MRPIFTARQNQVIRLLRRSGPIAVIPGLLLLGTTTLTRPVDAIASPTIHHSEPVPAGSSPPPLLRLAYSTKKRSIEEGQTLVIRATAKDPKHLPVSLDVRPLPPGATFSNGIFTWTPAYGTAEITPAQSITFTATNMPGYGIAPSTTAQTVTIQIGKNQPPAIDAITSPQQILPLKTVSIRVAATDPDGDNLRLYLNGLPSGMKFKYRKVSNNHGHVSGMLVWKPTTADIGRNYRIDIIAQETNLTLPQQASQTVELDVVSSSGTVGATPDAHGCIAPQHWDGGMQMCM